MIFSFRFNFETMKTPSLSICFSIVLLSFIGCSPKFTELNDQGFGGGFGMKGSQSIIQSNQCETKSMEITAIECHLKNFNAEISDTQDSTRIVSRSKYISPDIDKTSIKKPKHLYKKQMIQMNHETKKSILPNSKSSFLHWVYFIYSLGFIGYGISLLRDGILTWSKGNTFTDQMIGFFMSFFGLGITLLGVCMLIFSYLFNKISRKMCFTTKLGYALLPTFILTLPAIILILIGSIYDKFHR